MMSKIFILLFGSLIIFNCSFAQEYLKLLPVPIKEEVNRGIDCWKKGGADCTSIFERATENARAQKAYMPAVQIEFARAYLRANELGNAKALLDSVVKQTTPDVAKDSLHSAILIESYNLLSHLEYMNGDLDGSIKQLVTVLQLIEKYGSSKQAAYTKVNLAGLYSISSYNKKAIQLYLEAFNELKKQGEAAQTATIAANLATVYFDDQQTSEAVIWAQKALALAPQQENINATITGHYVLGAYFEKINADSAIHHLDLAIDLARKSNRSDKLAEALQVKGNVLNGLKQYKQALPLFDEAIKIQTEEEDIVNLLQSWKGAGVAAFQTKQYQEAASLFYNYALNNDSIFSEQNRTTVHEIAEKYETEKKEKLLAQQQLLIQKKQNQLILWSTGFAAVIAILLISLFQYRRTQKLKLLQSQKDKENAVLKAWMNGEERERNRISKDLHDGVASMIGAAKMSLQSVPFLAETQKAEQITKITKILDSTHTEVRRIAHDLLPLTLQQEGLKAALKQFVLDINDTGIIKLQLIDDSGTQLQLDKQIELMLFRIVQELINNVIKHSQATESVISLAVKEQQLSIAVEDNGTGFVSNRESQGLFSIKERLSAIGGEFEIGNKSNQGTRASLTFNLDKMS